MPNSGSFAMRSDVSASPFQGTIPAVCLAKLTAGRTVTRNLLVFFEGQWPRGPKYPIFISGFNRDHHGSFLVEITSLTDSAGPRHTI
jgi:hypothetical protein